MKAKTKNMFQVNIAVLMLAGTAMFAKGIELPVVNIISLRALIGALVLLGFIVIRRTSIRMKKRSHWWVMVLLGVMLCGHWITYFQALKVSSAAVAILALHTYPVFTALLEPIVFREKLRTSDVLAAATVLTGILIMTPQLSLSNDTTLGILLGVISALFWTVRSLMGRKYVQEYSSTTLNFWQMAVCGIVLLPWFTMGEGGLTPRSIWLLLLLGAVFTAVPQTLLMAGLKNLRALTVGIITTLLALYGPVMGWFVHGETVTLRTSIGGALILACVLWQTLRTARE